MYTVKLNDGTTLNNVELNGSCYISEGKIDKSVFSESNLINVTTTYENIEDCTTNMKLVAYHYDGRKTWYSFAKKTDDELKNEKMQSNIEYLSMMSGIDLEN